MSYSGRLTDLLIMQGASDSRGKVRVSLGFGQISKVVAGVQKAAQKWMVAFLTERGTYLPDPDYGTTFLSDTMLSNYRNGDAISTAFSRAAQDISSWFDNNVDLNSFPDDEVIEEAELLDFTFVDGTLSLRVKLTTRDGTARTYVTPISAVPQ